MTNLSMPETVLILGIIFIFRGRPLINWNSGWQWFDTKQVNTRDELTPRS